MRFRYGAAPRAAAVIWLLASSALATARWWLLPVMLVPLVAVAAVFRRGTDFDDEGVRVRALLGSRRLRWEEIADLRVAGPGALGQRRVVLVSVPGRALALPAVKPSDLARLTS